MARFHGALQAAIRLLRGNRRIAEIFINSTQHFIGLGLRAVIADAILRRTSRHDAISGRQVLIILLICFIDGCTLCHLSLYQMGSISFLDFAI